jgi:hypothetical protein
MILSFRATRAKRAESPPQSSFAAVAQCAPHAILAVNLPESGTLSNSPKVPGGWGCNLAGLQMIAAGPYNYLTRRKATKGAL